SIEAHHSFRRFSLPIAALPLVCNARAAIGRQLRVEANILVGTAARLRGAALAHPTIHNSHISVAALDVLAHDGCGDLIRDLDVPDFALALRGEVGEQLRDDRHIAYLVAAQTEAAGDVFKRGPAEYCVAVVEAVGAQLV